MITSIYLSIIVAVLILVLFVIFLARKKSSKPNYRALFILGLILLLIYFVSNSLFSRETSYIFFILGITYISIGLINKKQWGKEKPLTPKQNKAIFGAAIIGVIFFFLLQFVVLNFF